MTTLLNNEQRPALGIRATKTAPVIIATDGQSQSRGALFLGNILAGSPDAAIVVGVIPTVPMIPDVGPAMSIDASRTRRADLDRAVLDQTTAIMDGSVRTEILDGDPANVVARLAHTTGASLIVCGLGRHNVVDRILGDETALRIVRLADVPVLAVPEHKGHAPRSVVVACDFSETSLRAARLAVSIAAPNATIYLVHVAPRDHTRYEWDGWGKAYREDALDALNKTKQQLRAESNTIVQSIMLQGDTAAELLRFAENVHADLIATGSHGHGFVTRLLVGSVATRIVRAATCSVLTVPHAAVLTDARTTALPPIGRVIPRDDWSEALVTFSRRNAGRRTLLEVDDAEMGAQAQEFDYPFQGAAFDHHHQRVTIVFGGDDFGDGHHLTRGIAKPKEVNVLTDENARDIALRIVHGNGQTLMTFVG